MIKIHQFRCPRRDGPHISHSDDDEMKRNPVHTVPLQRLQHQEEEVVVLNWWQNQPWQGDDCRRMLMPQGGSQSPSSINAAMVHSHRDPARNAVSVMKYYLYCSTGVRASSPDLTRLILFLESNVDDEPMALVLSPRKHPIPQDTVEEIPGVNPVRGPVCASTGRRHAQGKIPAPLSEACVCPVRGPVHCLLLEISEEPTGRSTFRLRLSRSPRTQETVSPKSDHTPSICIKAEKIVGDRGPKGIRDSIPAGSTSSSVVDPLCHADIGEPRPEVWTYFRGEPARSCGFDSGFVCMGFAACLQATEQLQQLDQGVVVRLGGAQGEELRWRVLPEENSSDELNEFWEKIHTH
ncbi:hypothetical protein B0H13DRAFT_2289319 [Mycena leptocephala]|nr:hypothetical protein B0H13DRAFT_2289319 [Mycena leptocephala]